MSDRLGDIQVKVSNHSEHPMGCDCDLCFLYLELEKAKVRLLDNERDLARINDVEEERDIYKAGIKEKEAEISRLLGDTCLKRYRMVVAERDAAKKLAQDRLQEYLEMKAELQDDITVLRESLRSNQGKRARAEGELKEIHETNRQLEAENHILREQIDEAKKRCPICIFASTDQTQWLICQGCEVYHGYNGPLNLRNGVLDECHACRVKARVEELEDVCKIEAVQITTVVRSMRMTHVHRPDARLLAGAEFLEKIAGRLETIKEVKCTSAKGDSDAE